MATQKQLRQAERDEQAGLHAKGLKRCSRCTEVKPIEDYPLNRCTRDGLNRYCRPCYNAYGRGWRGKNAKYKKVQNAEWYQRNRERISAATRKHRVNNWVWTKLKNTRAWCEEKGVVYDLDSHIDALEARYALGVCEMTGLPFYLTPGGRTWNTPSFDRIDPAKGYTYDNVRIVLWIMNVAMSNWGEDRLHTVMTKWLEQRL